MRFFIAFFIILPLLEIILFIEIGGRIGLAWTLVWIAFTAIAGILVIRQQGRHTLAEVRACVNQGQVPAFALLHGLARVIAGILLILPGFLTDFVGMMLLLRPLRAWILHKIVRRNLLKIVLKSSSSAQSPIPPAAPPPSGRIFEGKYRNED